MDLEVVVDLPTLGKPTIPHCNAIIYLVIVYIFLFKLQR